MTEAAVAYIKGSRWVEEIAFCSFDTFYRSSTLSALEKSSKVVVATDEAFSCMKFMTNSKDETTKGDFTAQEDVEDCWKLSD